MEIKLIRLIIIFLIIVFALKQYNLYLYFSQELSEWIETPEICHILFTRYKEPDMSQLLSPLVNKKNVFIYIYNKGDDYPTGIPIESKNIQIINISNLGWDAYAYFHHVINNYDNLPDYIYSLHASAQYLPWKFQLLKSILDSPNISLNQNSYPYNYYYGGGINTTDPYFILDDWQSSLPINISSNVYVKSNIRPLILWIESHINHIPEHGIQYDDTHNLSIRCNYFGMFKVHKSKILKYSLEFYENIFNEISVWQSEVNHYLERSWFVFYGE